MPSYEENHEVEQKDMKKIEKYSQKNIYIEIVCKTLCVYV